MILERNNMLYEQGKRLIDILSVISLTIIFLPILIVLPFVIKLQSPGPVFYKHKRVGRGGKEFILYKFRTMYQNADEMLLKEKKLNDRFKKEKGGWKIPLNEDPRITPIGKFIRKFTLDEFPQLINILKGDMSLVGPRPYRKDGVGDEIQEQLKIFPHLKDEIKVLLSVKPGITGPWQVSGRNEIPWDQQIKLGAEYARKKSLLYDLYIIVKTPLAMFSKW
jgi:exopolysaccharide production protein ExoY